MKYPGKTFSALAFVMALSAITDAQAGGPATPGIGAGMMRAPNQGGYRSQGVMDTGAGAGDRADSALSRPMTKRSNGKTNSLNKGTNSGANSDVNRRLNGARQDGQ